MKPHIKVIQRNGVDIFVTSSMTMKETNADRDGKATLRRLAEGSRNSNHTVKLCDGRYFINPSVDAFWRVIK